MDRPIDVLTGPDLIRPGKRAPESYSSSCHRSYHPSLIAEVATAVIMGLGPDGCRAGFSTMVRMLGRYGS